MSTLVCSACALPENLMLQFAGKTNQDCKVVWWPTQPSEGVHQRLQGRGWAKHQAPARSCPAA